MEIYFFIKKLPLEKLFQSRASLDFFLKNLPAFSRSLFLIFFDSRIARFYKVTLDLRRVGSETGN
ncbi:hypothetical protein BES34_016250 [Leptospira inadai serovar Lyme]|uniref:Uncharacterized protein n=1 Tax=Leptospira inadai serovar Lyme TaxID=293084 RepID=A0ABX4YFK9_9LEPT|nr:hypothetical protein BES34_016250 [Leptospira inadai serovar Lyme]